MKFAPVLFVPVLALAAAAVPSAGQRPTAEARIAQARDAAGGPALAAVTALSLTGVRRSRNAFHGQISGAPEFSIQRISAQVLLPDHHLQERDLGPSIPIQRSGFAGNRVFGAPDLRQVRRNFGYNYALPMLLALDTVFTFTPIGLQDDAVRLRDAGGEEVLLDLDPATQLPRRLRYSQVIQGRPHDVVMDIDQHRAVPLSNGLTVRLPARLAITARPAKTQEPLVVLSETRFDQIIVNPPLTARDFR